MEMLRTEVIAGLTVLQLGSIVAGTLFALWLLGKLKGALSSQTPGRYQDRMKCLECGWVGVTSKHIPTCPRCRSRTLRPAP